MKNKMKKMAVIGLTMIGLVSQIGCGSLDGNCSDRINTATYTYTLQNDYFSDPIDFKIVADQNCDEGSLVYHQEISYTINGYSSSDFDLGIFENISGYSDSEEYTLDLPCEDLYDSATFYDGKYDRGEVKEFPQTVNCELTIDSSDDSQDHHFNFTLHLE